MKLLLKVFFLLFSLCFALPVFAFSDDAPPVAVDGSTNRGGFPDYKKEIIDAEKFEAEIRRRIDMLPGDRGPYYKQLNNAIKNGLDVQGDPVKLGGLSKARGFADAIDSLLQIGDADLFSAEASKVANELRDLKIKEIALEAQLNNPQTPYQEKIILRPKLDDMHKNLQRLEAKSDAMQHLYFKLKSAPSDAALRRVIPDMVEEGRIALEKFVVKGAEVNDAVRPFRLKEGFAQKNPNKMNGIERPRVNGTRNLFLISSNNDYSQKNGFPPEATIEARALAAKGESSASRLSLSTKEEFGIKALQSESIAAGTTPVRRLILNGKNLVRVTMVAGAVIEAYTFPGAYTEKALAAASHAELLFDPLSWFAGFTPNILPIPYGRYFPQTGLPRLMAGASVLSDPIKLDHAIATAVRMIREAEACRAKVADENQPNMNRVCTVQTFDASGNSSGFISLDARAGFSVPNVRGGRKSDVERQADLAMNREKLDSYLVDLYKDFNNMAALRIKMPNPADPVQENPATFEGVNTL